MAHNFQYDWDYCLIIGFRDEANFANVIHLFKRKCEKHCTPEQLALFDAGMLSEFIISFDLKRVKVAVAVNNYIVLPKYQSAIACVIGARSPAMFEALVDDSKTIIDVMLNIDSYKWTMCGIATLARISKSRLEERAVAYILPNERERTAGWRHCK